MKKLKIDVTKINKNYLFKGEKGTYLDLVLLDNRDGVDQYGNSGMIVQEVSREDREAGIKGPILGNWKEVGAKKSAAPRPQPTPQKRQTPVEDDDIPW